MSESPRSPFPLIAYLMPHARADELAHVLRRVHRGQAQRRLGGSQADEHAVRAMEPAERDKLRLLYGHMHFGTPGDIARFSRAIAMLGDPVRRVAALHKYILAMPAHYFHETLLEEGPDLGSFIRSRRCMEADNDQVRWLSGPGGHAVPIGSVSRDMLERAKRNLAEGVVAIGLAERYEESLALFATVLGWDSFDYPQSFVPGADPMEGVSAEDAGAILEANGLDAELHAFAARLFEEQIAHAGERFVQRLDRTRQARSGTDSSLPPAPSGPLPDPLYVFHHIPRSGGQSLRLALMRWFTLVEDYAEYDAEVDAFRFPARPDLSTLTPGHLLCGHWGLPGQNLFDRYPELAGHPGLRLITFLREPLELATSLHYYEQMHWKSHVTRTLDERLEITVNYSATTLGYNGALPPTGLDVQRFLERYWFVGITERMRESFDLLADRLGKPRAEVTRFNAAPRSSGGPSSDAVVRFRARSVLDGEIYRLAVERLDADLARHDPAMPPGADPIRPRALQ